MKLKQIIYVMKKHIVIPAKATILILSALLIVPSAFAQKKKKTDPLNNVAIEYLDHSFSVYDHLQKEIWRNAELGFLETKSSKALQDQLKTNGFAVEANVAGMPTAFVASFGSGSPVIGILAEFDALPGLSQDTVPYKKPVIEGGSGHGCGHNVFGVGSVAGAIAIRQWLEENHRPGTVKVFGTPAEEGGGGKVYMAREGIFKNVDVVLDWHPSSQNGVSRTSGLAIQMIDFSFYGKASHASGAPEKGRSALDGVEALDYLVNLLREHIPSDARVHYTITDGGGAPNVVPAFAKVSYYIRSPKRKDLTALVSRIQKAAEGAALGTETTVKSEIISGFYEKLPNETLGRQIQKNLEIVGGVHYDERERAFAEAIIEGIGWSKDSLYKVSTVEPWKDEPQKRGGEASSDVGDVSWNVPTASFGTAAFIPGSGGHSWENVASAGTTIGTKALINTAKVFSLTAIDLYTNPELVNAIKKEFEQRRGSDFKYEPLVGDRAPALDYRR
jgi:aminobenzoyl-glutamate utilization protein B